MRIIEDLLDHSRTVIGTLLFLLIAGTLAYINIPKEASPDVDVPINYILVSLEGISPEDAERLLVRPIEDEVSRIEGVKEITAQAFEGGGAIVLEFDAGFEADQAIDDVREAVDKARSELPPSAQDPSVHEVNTSLWPVMAVVLSGPVPERTLIRLARELKDDIEAMPSVLNVEIGGDRDEVVEILIDPLLIESYGLNGAELTGLLARSNRLVAAGSIDTGSGRFAVKVPGVFDNLEDILDMPIQVNGDAVVRFRDLAEIRRTFKDRQGFARLDGQSAVVLEVVKRTGENIIDTVNRVKEIAQASSADWPDNVRVTFHQEQSEFIEMMLHDLENHVIAAVLLVMIVIVGALGIRSGILVGISIPGSFLTAILVLSLMGLTVNMIVLFALILSIGVLVDAAIIVVEYADRKMAEGHPPREAYVAASRRMALPIIAATGTTLAAFLPLLFWPGIVGEFMKYFPITVLVTLSASLFMALIFVPTLGAFLGKAHISLAKQRALSAAESGRLDDVSGFSAAYLRLLERLVRYPGTVLLAAVLALVTAWTAYDRYGRGFEYFPAVEPDFAAVLVHARGNLSVNEQDDLVRRVEREVLKLEQEFSGVYTRSGAGVAGAGGGVGADVIGQITLEFKDWQHRRKAAVVLDEIRTATENIPGVRVEIREQEMGPPVGKPLQVQLTSTSPELLPSAVEHIRTFMENDPEIVDIEDERPIPGIDWELRVDRAQAAKFGLDLTAVGEATRLITTGLDIGTYRPDDTDDELDILVRYPESRRVLKELDQVRVTTPAGAVPISSFVSRQAQPRVGTLYRVDGERVMTVYADVAPGILVDDKVQELNAWLATEANFDPRIKARLLGEAQEQQEAQAFLSRAFGVALFIIAIILITQFNSFYSAFLILSAVVLSTIGALIGLMVTGQAFSTVVTGTGMIALAGVVVNDNIVLVDTFDKLKAQSKTVTEAILRTGIARLRPVVLTTVTTVLGLMPMMLGMNIDIMGRDISIGAPATQWWQSLATAIIFGLTFATMLTLIVTPCALQLRENVHNLLQGRRHAAKPVSPTGR